LPGVLHALLTENAALRLIRSDQRLRSKRLADADSRLHAALVVIRKASAPRVENSFAPLPEIGMRICLPMGQTALLRDLP
jgi:hypothetical protein